MFLDHIHYLDALGERRMKTYVKFRPKRRLLFTLLLTGLFIQCIRLTRLNSDKGTRASRIERAAVEEPSNAPTTYNPAPVELFNGHHTRMRVPSVILRPIPGSGGIGDQLYRYAYAYTAARDLNTTLYVAVRPLDLTDRRSYGFNDRKFALDHFRLNSSMVKYVKDKTYGAIPRGRVLLLDELGPWREHELPHNKLVVVTEYWQSDMYFGRYKQELAAQFVPKDSVKGKSWLRDLVQAIGNSESVAVHVRRGDFRGKEGKFWLYRVLPISYQLRAIELMEYLLKTRRETVGSTSRELPVTYFVFSDDISYAREQMSHINASHALVFVSNSTSELTSIDEFELMSLCKHNIIPNSGYAWWTAWLNPNPTKLVIAPFPRHRYRFYPGYGLPGNVFRKHKENLYWNHTYPSSWITLNPYESYDDMM